MGKAPTKRQLEIIKKKTYYKITNKKEIHNGFKYKTGLNTLKEEFATAKEGECVPGGFYFSDKKNLRHWYGFGVHIREVTLPSDAQIVILKHKFRADKIILGQRYNLYSSKPKPIKIKIDGLYIIDYINNTNDTLAMRTAFLKKHREKMPDLWHIAKSFNDHNKMTTPAFKLYLKNDVFTIKYLLGFIGNRFCMSSPLTSIIKNYLKEHK